MASQARVVPWLRVVVARVLSWAVGVAVWAFAQAVVTQVVTRVMLAQVWVVAAQQVQAVVLAQVVAFSATLDECL